GKRAVFFPATQQAQGVELRRIHEAVTRDLGLAAADLSGGGFTSWEAALRFFAALARPDPLLVILDEVPYLARSTPGFASVVQSVWDHLGQGTRLMFVLTGSAIGTMESMLGAGGALRGRPSLTLRLDPVTWSASRAFLPTLPAESLLEAYAACGGYPLHLKAWDPSASTATNLLRLAWSAGGILLDDATGMLHEELPETGGYARILAAIGRGRTRLTDIEADAAQRVEHPLEVLQRSGFIRRSTPVGAPRRARPLYEIDDPYLAFWFGVLYSDLGLIDGGQGRAVLGRRRPQWQRHIGWVFEEQARAHAARLVAAGTLPEDMLVGRWWASTGEPCEVDVIGLSGARTAMLGEAKWQARPLGPRELRELMAKATRVPDVVEHPQIVLWGRGGLDPALAGAGLLGFGPEDMLTT
ncbi:MAG: ATP-binding protein, partial [Actinomycetota bacterium]